MQTIFRKVPAAAVVVLAACGGGNSGAPQAPSPTPTSGLAVDGYLKLADATCDANEDGLVSAGEVTVKTSSDPATLGKYTFPNGCSHGVIVKGGIDAGTDLPFKGVLRAPAGSAVATPLTTLLASGLTQAEVRASLGISNNVDLQTADPAATSGGVLVNADLMKKTLALQQLMQKATDVLTGLVAGEGSDIVQPVYAEVAASFANSLKTRTLVLSATTVDETVVAALVKDAVEKVRASNRVSAAVKDAAAAMNADSMGEVVKGGLKLHADQILGATADTLNDETKKQQEDDKVKNFVAGKKTELAAAPTTDIAVLGVSLTNQVKDSGTVAPATNYLALAGDSLSLVSGSSPVDYSMTAFTSDAGINVKWPLSSTASIKLGFSQIGAFSLASGQNLSAALQIQETAGGQGEVRAYIDKVSIRKTGSTLEFEVPVTANAMVYGVSTDGKKKAVVNFDSGVRGIRNTLGLSGNNTILLGDVVQYAVNNVSNQFTGINALRGKYKVSIVVSDLPLRKLDGSRLPTLGLAVPTELGAGGVVAKSASVVGAGLVGFINLTD